jgi:O-antigen ligase
MLTPEMRIASSSKIDLRRPHVALVSVLAVAAPLTNHLYLPAIALLALGALVIDGLRRGRFRVAERNERFVLLFTAYAVLSCLWTPAYVAPAWLNVIMEYAGLAATFVLVNRLASTASAWKWIGACYVAGCVLVSMVVIYNWAIGNSYEGAGRYSVNGVNANFTAYALVTALPIATALFVSHPRRSVAVPVAATLLWVFIGAAIVLTGCRGAVLAGAAGALVGAGALVVVRPALGAVVLAASVGVAVQFAAPVLEAVPQRLLISEALQENDWSSGRLDIWGRALDVYRDHPVFGAGADAFPSLNPDGVHAHNVVLTILAEFGVVGMGLFVVAVAPLFLTSLVGASLLGRASALMALLVWLTIALTGVWQFAIPAWLSMAWMTKMGLHLPGRTFRAPVETAGKSWQTTVGERT